MYSIVVQWLMGFITDTQISRFHLYIRKIIWHNVLCMHEKDIQPTLRQWVILKPGWGRIVSTIITYKPGMRSKN